MAPLPPDYYHEKLLIVQVKTAALAPVQSSWNPMGLPNSVNAWLLSRFMLGRIKHAEPLVRLGTPVFRVTNPLAPTLAQSVQAKQWRELAFPRLDEELATVPDSISAERQTWFLRLRSQIYIFANSGIDCSALREEALILAESGKDVVDFAEFIPKYTLSHHEPLEPVWPLISIPAPGGSSFDPGLPLPAARPSRSRPSKEPGPSISTVGLPADDLALYSNPLWAHKRVGWTIPADSSKIAIATLDTGANWAHPSISEALCVAPDFYVNALNLSTKKWLQRDREDQRGHGTSVASILAARVTQPTIPLEWEYLSNPDAPSAPRSFSGMLPQALVYPYKVMNGADASVDPQRYISALASIVNLAATTGIRAVNISIYKMGYELAQMVPGAKFQSEAGWINDLDSKGIVCVACAGNNYGRGDTPWVDPTAPYRVEFPAQNVNVLAVGAALSNGELAPFSNYTITSAYALDKSTYNKHIGPVVARNGESPASSLDVIAPGKNMLAALPNWPDKYGAHPIYKFGVCYRNGTSFAAPMVTAVAAWLAATQQLSPAKIRKAIRLSAINNLQPSQAPDFPGAAKAGCGLIDCTWLAKAKNLAGL